ncbi:MAG: hypothetical protein GC180_10885 [Bacteroidetes bacterium]|nr:hypothetical protein [Bacteroidota bacterium]
MIGAEQLTAQPNFKRVCIKSNNTDIILFWDISADPCSKFQEIEVFARPNDFTAFSSIGTITNAAQNSFVHAGAAVLTEKWSYQLIYRYLCDNSEFKSDTLYIDLTQPNSSEYDSVSYDPVSNGYFLSWSPNNAVDLFGYYLWEHENTNNNNFKFDSVYQGTSYLDTHLDPFTGQHFYTLTAFDSCNNQSVISQPHAAPFIQGKSKNCGRDIDLSWTPYIGHGNTYFQIYLSIDGADYFIDTTLQGSQNTYSIRIKSGQKVEVFVRAGLDNGASSRSIPIQFQALDSFQISKNYLSAVSWVAPNTVELHGTYDNPVNFDSIYVYQQTETNQIYYWKDDINNNPYPLRVLIPSDTLTYKFAHELIDRCGRHYRSNEAYNVVLSGIETSTDNYSIEWTQPNYLDGGIDIVEIHLGDNLSKYSTWNILENNVSDSFYSKHITQENLNIRCFQILSKENNPNSYGFSETIYSNPKCFIQSPSIYFPNAISVRGINNTFRAVGLSIDSDQSTLKIYGRNGQLVHSGKLSDGWNGLDPNGNAYQTTVFIYLADVYFLTGKRAQYSGNFTVLY